MKKLCIFITALATILVLIAAPITAAVIYQGMIKVTSTATYTQIPLILMADVTEMVADGYCLPDGTDLSVNDGSYYLKSMPAEDRINFVVPALASGTSTYQLRTATDPPAVSFPIVAGYGGYVTTPNNATLELDSNSIVEISGYFLTGADQVGEYIINKTGVLSIQVTAEGEITIILFEESTNIISMASGYYTIKMAIGS